MRKKAIAILLVLTMAAAALVACGNNNSGNEKGKKSENEASTGESEEVTLQFTWWGNQVRNDLTKQVVDLYMEKNPNINIKVEFTDYVSYWDKMSAMAAGGNLPDIIQLDYGYLGNYQSSGQLADLTEYINGGTIDTNKINGTVIDSSTIDGKCYGIASGATALMMDYDIETVNKAGVEIPDQMTLDEFYDISKTIYEKTGVKTLWDGTSNALSYIARMNDKFFIDEIREGDDTSVKEHFELVKKFADSEFAVKPEILAEKNFAIVETKPINDLTTWNDFSYCNQYISISQAAGRELGITMYPVRGDELKQPMYLQPAAYLGIAETSEHKEEAAKFIDWFVNSIECNEILKGERGTPVNSEVADTLKAESDSKGQTVYEYMGEVEKVATPVDPLYSDGKAEIDALLDTTVEKIRSGDITVEEATESFMAEAARILSDFEE